MKNNNILPMGFDKLKTDKPYINLGKLPEGEHRFRIVSRPIAGWLDWKDNKPYRYRPEKKPAKSFNPEVPLRPFWAMHVWDYAREGLYVMEITQNSIRKSLEGFALNEDWGDFTGYDIKIKKEGSGKDTKYSVMPVPHKPLAATIKEKVKNTKIRLEALYEGKDPWVDLEEVNEETGEILDFLSEEQCAQLDTLIQELDDQKVIDFLCKRESVEVIYDIHVSRFNDIVEYLKKEIGRGSAVA